MSEQNICIDPFAAPAVKKADLRPFQFGRLLAEFRAWREKLETLRQLRRLDDRQLRDIGVRRHDLPPALQDTLVSPRDRSGLLDLFPHAIATPVASRRPKICD